MTATIAEFDVRMFPMIARSCEFERQIFLWGLCEHAVFDETFLYKVLITYERRGKTLSKYMKGPVARRIDANVVDA